METPEQYTVKTPEEILRKYFPSGVMPEPECDDVTEIFVLKAMREYSSELRKENERLKGTIGAEAVRQNLELKQAINELMRFESSMRYATTAALNEPGNFTKALDRLSALSKHQPIKKDEN